MQRIINENENASTLINGIAFEPWPTGMISCAPVEEPDLSLFLSIPGFFVLEQEIMAAPIEAPVVIDPAGDLVATGTVTAFATEPAPEAAKQADTATPPPGDESVQEKGAEAPTAPPGDSTPPPAADATTPPPATEAATPPPAPPAPPAAPQKKITKANAKRN